jgi:hypothetical protein
MQRGCRRDTARTVHLRRSSLVAFASLLLLPLAARTARADVSSWLFLGAGPSGLYRSGASASYAASMQLDAGMGSTPKAPIAVGGLARVQTRFGDGTDAGLFVRTATGGFVRGNWGGALDLGGFGRFWGKTSPGYAGSVSLGGPWGLTVGLDAAHATSGGSTFAAVLGIDLARMSVYRTTGLDWLPNPFPSPRPGEE